MMMMAASSSVQTASCRVTGARRGTVSRSAHAASSATARASGFVAASELPARAARRGAVSSACVVARAQRLHRGEEGSLRSRAPPRARSTARLADRLRPEIFTANTVPRPANRLREGAEPSNQARARRPARHLANIRALWRWRAPHTDDALPASPSSRASPPASVPVQAPRRAVIFRAAAEEDGSQPGGTGDDARVVVITSARAVSGKTTTSANLGMSIRSLGDRVCLVDADIGLRNLDLLLGLENRVKARTRDGGARGRVPHGAGAHPRQAVAIAGAPPHLEESPKVQRDQGPSISADILKDMNFQYIFIDCPAGIDVGFINAIAGANESIIVTTPEITAIRRRLVAQRRSAQAMRHDVKLVVNRVRADMIKKNDMMSVKDVQEMLGVPLLGAIPEDTEVIVSTNRGVPLVLKKKLRGADGARTKTRRGGWWARRICRDLEQPKKSFLQRTKEFFTGSD